MKTRLAFEDITNLYAMPSQQTPAWTNAALEALTAFKARTSQEPSHALIGTLAAKHMRDLNGRDDTLFGYPTRIVEDHWHGVDWQ